MGVAGMIVTTLASGFIQGKAQQNAYKAQAQQAEANARQLQLNAEKMQATAEEQDRANKINEENQRRIREAKLARQRVNIGASGVSASGSAANALMDSKEAMEQEAAIEAYNNRQKIDSIFQNQTNMVNQAEQYRTDAANYRSAGKQAFRNSMIKTAFSLASSLYSSKSAANASQGSGVSFDGQYKYGTITNGSWAANTASTGNKIDIGVNTNFLAPSSFTYKSKYGL